MDQTLRADCWVLMLPFYYIFTGCAVYDMKYCFMFRMICIISSYCAHLYWYCYGIVTDPSPIKYYVRLLHYIDDDWSPKLVLMSIAFQVPSFPALSRYLQNLTLGSGYCGVYSWKLVRPKSAACAITKNLIVQLKRSIDEARDFRSRNLWLRMFYTALFISSRSSYLHTWN
jgi:hypothetical protein